ncbi:MAG: hypothetical protein KAX72_04985, partial [Chitinophagales bacterium]|nr:hypothetical protein [Chitinophagales bacterium]
NLGVFDEYDYWAGTVSLVIFALIEIILFGWVFGMEKGWLEITDGADIKVPRIMIYLIKFVTPILLGFVFFMSLDEIITKATDFSSTPVVLSRLLLLGLWIGIALLVRNAYYKRIREGRFLNMDDIKSKNKK